MRKHHFPLVLLDLMMPHLNGIGVLEKIKREFPDSECVVVSANDEVATAVEAMSLGASDYLVKPLNSEKLIAMVNRSLENIISRMNWRDSAEKKFLLN